MAITYEHFLFNGTDAYLNLKDGVTSRTRVKKLDDLSEIKNLDYDTPIADLLAISDADLQAVIDGMIADDEANDEAIAAAAAIVPPPIDPAVNTKVKKIKTKSKKV